MQITHDSGHGKDPPTQNGIHVPQGQKEIARCQKFHSQQQRRSHQNGIQRS